MLASKLANSEILTDILISFQQVLENTGQIEALKQVDESFHRICAGIVLNTEKFDTPKILNLVQSLISETAEYLKDKSQKKKSYIISPITKLSCQLFKIHDGLGDSKSRAPTLTRLRHITTPPPLIPPYGVSPLGAQ
ncbi:hypothetical protein PSHT_13382 [Puccinia striiformis]|uniref:Uncharacterized protein n=2 Tax=Puccinia striiformis TaxID=27350 RepID=A0A2S4URH5_9BASI|nr:hypothetical protein Pst134EB_018471 [Puccinia striiformis f. sp. tritici]KAI9607252.1 hypothetical protein H4Q26_005769 [Puccinia striiformis f. sp. tritici PST-130]POV99807.1 hypothetical protein PSHT_13382 [Puccinia striiformis]POW17251.1 hypothetical protein PSTT_00528 [Puccinia striiformis]